MEEKIYDFIKFNDILQKMVEGFPLRVFILEPEGNRFLPFQIKEPKDKILISNEDNLEKHTTDGYDYTAGLFYKEIESKKFEIKFCNLWETEEATYISEYAFNDYLSVDAVTKLYENDMIPQELMEDNKGKEQEDFIFKETVKMIDKCYKGKILAIIIKDAEKED